MVNAINDATPAEIDSRLDVLNHQIARHNSRYSHIQRRRQPSDWEAHLVRIAGDIDRLNEEALPLEQEFDRRGGWTRAFQVISSDGHIHRSRHCTTTYPTTQWAWLPEVSGKDESQIIDLAGESACTVCYPHAPVATRTQPARIGSAAAQRAERDARATARAAKDAATAAKAISNPDGTRLYVESHSGAVTTEATATQVYVDFVLDAEDWGDGFHREHFPAEHCDALVTRYRRDADILLAALAAKHETTPGEMATRLEPKVTAKRKRNAAAARKAANTRS